VSYCSSRGRQPPPQRHRRRPLAPSSLSTLPILTSPDADACLRHCREPGQPTLTPGDATVADAEATTIGYRAGAPPPRSPQLAPRPGGSGPRDAPIRPDPLGPNAVDAADAEHTVAGAGHMDGRSGMLRCRLLVPVRVHGPPRQAPRSSAGESVLAWPTHRRE
jgi:hypothetical protein